MEIRLRKMEATLDDVVQYKLNDEQTVIEVNALIGKKISLNFNGKVQCMNCQTFPRKLFAQGFCYNCFMSAPQAADWVLHPEKSKAHLGIEERDLEYEKMIQLKPHFVYLAVASALKVGVTRGTQIPTRWIDQGASFAIKVAETPHRQLAGEIEVALKTHFTDKTNWRKMLKNEVAHFDLEEEKWKIEELLPNDLSQYMTEDDEIIEIKYPVIEYPEKVRSIGFDKQPLIEGTLLGIKGQYLIFEDNKVLNIRKHEGYYVELNY
ncbi:MAG TPA: DUF2797 domain-containing protein [Crocinitomix sp.]|nr:DUF2797 domain-containing protein [Crocinitomix sp.]